MKKYLSAILAVLLVTMTMWVPTVSAENRPVFVMDTANAVRKWTVGRWSDDPITDANISQEHVKMGSYSMKVQNIDSASGKFNIQLQNLNLPIGGASKICMWVYADINNSTNIRQRIVVTLSDASTIINMYTYTQGWNMVTFDVPAAKRTASINNIALSTYGYGTQIENCVQEYKDAIMYYDGIFVTDGDITSPQFTSASIAEGAQLVKHDVGKITFNSPVVKSVDALADITISPAVALGKSIVNGKLELTFGNLSYGTNYTVSVNGGVYDACGLEFEPFTLNFRVRGENENCPPTVELNSPNNGDRFIPEDEITLSAYAWDDPEINNGSIQYVEFLCDGEVIPGSRVTAGVDNVYTYVWTGAEESLDSYEITAKTVDNDGAEVVSDSVLIRVLGYKEPTVSITSPEDGAELTSSVGGVTPAQGITVTAELSDLDSEIVEARVYLDNVLVYTATEGFDEFSYTFPEALPGGEHKITVAATDDMELSGDASVYLNIVDLGVSYPAILENDLTLAKWDIVGDVDNLEKTEDGVVISTDTNETVQIGRKLLRNLSLSPWQSDVVIVPKDASHTIEIGLIGNASNTHSLVTFEADGTLNDEGNTAYSADARYIVSGVVDTVGGTVSCIVNGNVLSTKSYTASNFSSSAIMYVKHSGASAATVVESLEFYSLKEAAALSDVNITTGTTEDSLSAVPLLPDYITVSLSGGTDVDTVAGNVRVFEKETGKEIAVSYLGDKIYFEEFLKSGKEYTVSVGAAVSNEDGRGLAGAQTVDFTAAKAPVHIEMTEQGSSLKVKAENTTGNSINSKIVIIASNGGKAVLPIAVSDFTINTGDSETTVSLPTVDENTVIQAFVVDDITTLKPISDSVFIKK